MCILSVASVWTQRSPGTLVLFVSLHSLFLPPPFSLCSWRKVHFLSSQQSTWAERRMTVEVSASGVRFYRQVEKWEWRWIHFFNPERLRKQLWALLCHLTVPDRSRIRRDSGCLFLRKLRLCPRLSLQVLSSQSSCRSASGSSVPPLCPALLNSTLQSTAICTTSSPGLKSAWWILRHVMSVFLHIFT